MDLRWDKPEGVWWIAASILLALFVVTLGVQTFDKRVLAGESVWAKPLKFYLALSLHFATLAAVMSVLSEASRSSAALFWLALASVGCAAFEMAYMVVRAARQEASHFNLATPFVANMYALMALGAVVITVAAGIIGSVALLDSSPRLHDPVRIAIALGLIGGQC